MQRWTWWFGIVLGGVLVLAGSAETVRLVRTGDGGLYFWFPTLVGGGALVMAGTLLLSRAPVLGSVLTTVGALAAILPTMWTLVVPVLLVALVVITAKQAATAVEREHRLERESNADVLTRRPISQADSRGMGTSPRIRRRIERDFPEPGRAKEVEELLTAAVASLDLDHWGAHALERIQAAIVLGAHGDLAGVRAMRDLALQDWRDALVAADLAGQDWPERLDAELGPG